MNRIERIRESPARAARVQQSPPTADHRRTTSTITGPNNCADAGRCRAAAPTNRPTKITSADRGDYVGLELRLCYLQPFHRAESTEMAGVMTPSP